MQAHETKGPASGDPSPLQPRSVGGILPPPMLHLGRLLTPLPPNAPPLFPPNAPPPVQELSLSVADAGPAAAGEVAALLARRVVKHLDAGLLVRRGGGGGGTRGGERGGRCRGVRAARMPVIEAPRRWPTGETEDRIPPNQCKRAPKLCNPNPEPLPPPRNPKSYPAPSFQGSKLHASFYVACLEALLLGPGGRKLPEELARVRVQSLGGGGAA